MLAHDLIRTKPDDVELIAASQQEVDITDAAAVRSAVRGIRPTVVLNAAAYTDVDGAESNRDRAFLINAEAAGLIGSVAADLGINEQVRIPLVVHYSTDYVFRGVQHRPYRESDPTDPLGIYGASKRAGEQALATSGARFLIIRTQWLFGIHGKSFPRTIWERANRGAPTRVVKDQLGRPTYTVDLAAATWKLIDTDVGEKARNFIHVANSGTATWYDVARYVFEAAGAARFLSPCTTAEYPTVARRPAWSVLDTSLHDELTGHPLPPWEDAVDRFLAELKAETQ